MADSFAQAIKNARCHFYNLVTILEENLVTFHTKPNSVEKVTWYYCRLSTNIYNEYINFYYIIHFFINQKKVVNVGLVQPA